MPRREKAASSDHKILAEQDLLRSGLTLRSVANCGVSVLAPEHTQKLGHAFALPALCFSYWRPYESRYAPLDEFHRVRYLEEPIGFAAQQGKTQRYSQPPKTLNDIYVPRQVEWKDYDWPTYFDKPSLPLYFTEGEKKALCACSKGLPFLALGGVSMWSAQGRGLRELPLLSKINFKGRDVYVVFDTDEDGGMKREVLDAAKRLMEWLLLKGATPSLAILPADGKKVGLDDYLVAHGAESFLNTVLPAHEFNYTDAAVLTQAAASHAYLGDLDRFASLDPDRDQTYMAPGHYDRATGMKEVSLPRLERIRVQGGGFMIRVQPKVVKLSEAMLAWGGTQRFESAVYRPGTPRVVQNEERLLLNLWTGWRSEYAGTDRLPAPAAREKILSKWFWALDNVFGDDPEARSFAEHWLHRPLLEPGVKLYTFALVTSREEGIGKSFIGHMLASHVYGLVRPGHRHAWQLSEGDLANAFNPYLNATSFVECDDLGSKDKRSVYERVRSFVTSDTVQVNMKGVPQFMLENRANFWVTSNDPAPFYLSDKDRRAFVHVPTKAVKDSERYHALSLEFQGGRAGPTLLWYAREKYNASGFDPKMEAPCTAGKIDVTLSGAGTLREWTMTLEIETLTRPFATPRELHALMVAEVPGGDKYSVDALGRALRDAGAVRWREGQPANVKEGNTIRRERVWVLGAGFPVEHGGMTEALARPFGRKRVELAAKDGKKVRKF